MFYNMLKIIEMEVTVMNTGTNITPITEDSNESKNMWSQFATSSKNGTRKHRGKKYIPYVLTEQGIAMLSGLLRNEIAVQVSINIMNAFVEMRKFISLNGQVFERLTSVEQIFIDLLYIIIII